MESQRYGKRIGLITFHKFNYGSALQCYATQEYLRGKGFEVDQIDFAPETNFIRRYAKAMWNLLTLSLFHPFSVKPIISIFKSQRRNGLRITKESESLISSFNDEFINCKLYPSKSIRQIAKESIYKTFLSGSDQVWNGYRIDLYDLYFLRFAPKYKRIAWAVSFGGNVIASYNRKKYIRYIKDFRAISVREPSAVDLVKSLTGRDAVCLSDPVVLLNEEKWRSLYQKNSKIEKSSEKYILFFFLDKPSERSVKAAEQLACQTSSKITTFGYKQQGVDIHKEGGPWEFLSVIDNAEYVVTDSFHATVFALIFRKKFYVFDRQYVHKQSQASRITDLLNRTGLINRFSPEKVDDMNPNYSLVENVFIRARENYDIFINNEII